MALTNRPNSYSSGNKIKSSEVNTDLNAIYNDYNGNVTNANLSATAGIVGSKLDLSSPGTIGATTPGIASFSVMTATLLTGGNMSISSATENVLSLTSTTTTGNNLFIDQDGNGIPINIDSESTNHGIYLDIGGTLGAGKRGLYVIATAAQTAAGLVDFTLPAGSDQDLLTLTNAGTGKGLYINQDGNGPSIDIDSESTDDGVKVDVGGVLDTGKRGLNVSSSAAQTTAGLVDFSLSNGGSDQDLLTLTNAGTGKGLFINQDGNGSGIDIDSESTGDGIKVDIGGVMDTGKRGLNVSSSASQTTSGLVDFSLSNSSSSQPLLTLTNAGSGNALAINQDGNSNAINIDADVNTAGNYAAVQIDSTNAGVGTGCAFSFSGDCAVGTSTFLVLIDGALRQVLTVAA